MTNLRKKGSQYEEVTKALDLLLDGPTKEDKQILQDLTAASDRILPPKPFGRNKVANMARSVHQPNKSVTSPFSEVGRDILRSQDQ